MVPAVSMQDKSSVKAILYALGANVGIAIAKSIAAFMTNSGAMLAEAIHSIADSCNQGLLFLGMASSKKPASPEHPLGYGKAIYFWSFVVALMLFSMGGLVSIYEGIHKLKSKTSLENPMVAIIVLIIGVILEASSLIGALRIIKKKSKGKSLWFWFRNSRQSELIVIFGEDTAAVVGLLIAMVAIILTITTGNLFYDAIGSIAIGVLLILVAVSIAIEVESLLIGESADPEVQKEIVTFISEQQFVEKIFNVITFQMGIYVMVSAKIMPRATLSLNELIDCTNQCEKGLKEKFPQVRWVFLEPDFYD